MKITAWRALVPCLVLLGCQGTEPSTTPLGSGGKTATGGAPSTGGLPTSGGAHASGGAKSGGSPASGGQPNSGGSAPVTSGGVGATGGAGQITGGNLASGGTPTVTGGTTTGGKTATGGTPSATGGLPLSTGGVDGGVSGDAQAVMTGGSLATGGQIATGGSLAIGTIKNPVIKGYWADPQVALFNGKFYIYPTTDGIANWGATVFHAFSSPDLATWKDEGIILDLASVSWGKANAWAPGITVKNGTYYFYFCASKQIGVATSTSPTGPFKDVMGKALVTAGQFGGQSIDPYVFDDDNGRSYLFFGNGATAHGAELNADMVSFKATPTSIALKDFREGSAVFKRNGKYYFMYSISGTDAPDYRVGYAMSNTPLGPYSGGATILQSNTGQGILSTGHNSVLALPNGDYYIVYHRWAIPGGDGNHRETCIDKMKFNTDGTIAPVVPTL